MASVQAALGCGKTLTVSNPWPWLGMGSSLTLWSFLWTRTFGADSSDARIIVLALGLLCTALGVWLRWNDRQKMYLSPSSPAVAQSLRLLMGGVYVLTALGMTVLLALALFGSEQSRWKPGSTFLVWLTVAPAGWFAFWHCLKRPPAQPALGAREEISLSLLLAAVLSFAGSLTLNLGGEDATDWDTLRMFLRVLTALSLFASALVLGSMRLQRLVISLIITMHFAAISTAVLAAPPSPWLMQQAWTRLFRPYLEFLYLNNAYHFYAPEPGPVSYLWFRLIYDTPEGGAYGWWYKVPQMDDQGRYNHTFDLEYQRLVAMTESIAANDPPPPYVNEKGEVDPYYVSRLQLIPRPAEEGALVIGIKRSEEFRIPLDPSLQPIQLQVMKPNSGSRRLLASYVRFVARKFARHPEQPGWSLRSVKVYRVVHLIPQPAWLNNGLPPTDPALYRPYYLGNHDALGSLLDAESPYVYWLLPVLRANPNDPESKIRDFARLHAGDPHWVRPKLQLNQQTDPPPWGLPDDEDQKLVQP